MFNEYGPISGRIENRSVFILRVVLLAVILVMMCCVLSFMLNNQLKEPSPKPLPDIPVKIIPTVAIPADPISMYLPVILSRSKPVSVPKQIWKVTNIIVQGYELGGQRNDLAAFTRIDGQTTGQGYCINPGWAIPELGTEYLLNEKGIFIPLYQSESQPIQRFSKIR